jgi:hypothetical protein
MPLIKNTDPQIEEMMIEAYRTMKPQEKWAQVEAMTRTFLHLAEARIRERHEGISDRELLLRMGSLWIDRDTMIKAFGWDPDKEGIDMVLKNNNL